MKIRLFLKESLENGKKIILNKEQSHYLTIVLRLKNGESIFVFTEGVEYEAIVFLHNKTCILHLQKQIRYEEEDEIKVTLAFSLIKNNALSELLNNATQVGVNNFIPLITKHSSVNFFNKERAEKIIIEACEQSERLYIPKIFEPIKLENFILNHQKPIIFCDELNAKNEKTFKHLNKESTILIGPEGGFAREERDLINSKANIINISLGKNILRAEVAAVCATFLVKNKSFE